MLRREFRGSVISTTLSGGISDTDLSIALTDGSTFPTGSSNPFVIVIDRAHFQAGYWLMIYGLHQLNILQMGMNIFGMKKNKIGKKIEVLD